jgi:hypothetical protein
MKKIDICWSEIRAEEWGAGARFFCKNAKKGPKFQNGHFSIVEKG